MSKLTEEQLWERFDDWTTADFTYQFGFNGWIAEQVQSGKLFYCTECNSYFNSKVDMSDTANICQTCQDKTRSKP